MAETAQGNVLVEIDGQVATVTLNRPEKLNALTLDMLDALAEIAARLDADRAVRCVILTAAGDQAFCVGADINAWSALEPLDMWRSLGEARPSGVRPVGAAAATGDRGDQRPRTRRRTGTGGDRGYPRRRTGARSSACRKLAIAHCARAGPARSGWLA